MSREILDIPACERCGLLTPNKVCNRCMPIVKGGQGRTSSDVVDDAMGLGAVLVVIVAALLVFGGIVGGLAFLVERVMR